MPLSTAELQAVQRRTQSARNTAAAVRRAANRQRVSGAIVLRASDDAGLPYTLVMVTTKEPGKAYLVARDKKTQEWVCGCFAARWQGLCDHLEAIRAHDERKDPMMTTQNYPHDAEPEPARLVTGPKGTKILQTPAAARSMKAKGPEHSGLKVFPRPTAASTTDATDAEEEKDDAA